MKINLKCFGKLAAEYNCEYDSSRSVELDDGANVSSVIKSSGLDEAEVKIVFVNNRISNPNQSLRDGDRVTLVPNTGGM